MFIVQANGKRRGFTLLEVMLAVAILAGLSLAIYRFVQSNIVALRVAGEASAIDARYDALRDFLTASLQGLPAGSAALTGDAVKVNDQSKDRITWDCSAGPGVLTRYAPGDYVVTMQLRAPNDKSERLDLGLLRKPQQDRAFTNVNESWVPLIEDIASLQIRYFDPRLNVWQDKWTDTITLPRLVRVTIRRNGAQQPWDAIIPLGRTPL